MIAYLDSSVLLRILLAQPGGLDEWEEVEIGVTSKLTRVECSRTLNRLLLANMLDQDDFAQRQAMFVDIWARLVILPLDDAILNAAAGPLPTKISSLDAIQLVSALSYRDAQPGDEPSIHMATHDQELAVAARAVGFAVIGTP